jgi:hypothetical protein
MKKFNMDELKLVSTPMSTVTSLDPDENGEVVDQREYRSTKQIQFIMCLCACFQASPRSLHRMVVQRIFRYLKHTPEFRIWYSASSSLDLIGFSDADFAGCGIDRKSISSTCHFLGYSLICWYSRKNLQLLNPP